MTFAKLHKVLGFIRQFKGKYSSEMEDRFSNGFCYWFAVILKERFDGEIYFNPIDIHFATLIDKQMFDIYGLMDIQKNDSWYDWEEYKRNNDPQDIIKACILKE